MDGELIDKEDYYFTMNYRNASDALRACLKPALQIDQPHGQRLLKELRK